MTLLIYCGIIDSVDVTLSILAILSLGKHRIKLAKKTDTKTMAIRDSKGRFVPGHPSIKTPKVKRERPYLDIMYQECDLDTWQGVISKAIEQALDGDRHARSFLADYIIGPPVKRIQAAIETGSTQVIDVDRQIRQFLAVIQVVINEASTNSLDSDDTVDGELIE